MKNSTLRYGLLTLWMVTFVVGPVRSQEALERTSYLPHFESTKENIDVLESNLAKTGELADVLKRGNDELSEAIRQYRQDRKPEMKDRVYGLLGDLAGTTVRQIDDIVANKDRMRDGVGQILYKMQHIQTTLTDRQKKFSEYVRSAQENAEAVKEQLRDMARQIKADPENKALRKEFRNALFRLRSLDQQYKTYQAHQRLNVKFAHQVDLAQQFFEQLHLNTEQLVSNLQQQKDFLVMKVGLLKDAAEMESWLRGENEGNASAFALMSKIGELSTALEKFNAATDVLVELNDIDTLIESMPDAGDIFGIGGVSGSDGGNTEDKYVEYFLKN